MLLHIQYNYSLDYLFKPASNSANHPFDNLFTIHFTTHSNSSIHQPNHCNIYNSIKPVLLPFHQIISPPPPHSQSTHTTTPSQSTHTTPSTQSTHTTPPSQSTHPTTPSQITHSTILFNNFISAPFYQSIQSLLYHSTNPPHPTIIPLLSFSSPFHHLIIPPHHTTPSFHPSYPPFYNSTPSQATIPHPTPPHPTIPHPNPPHHSTHLHSLPPDHHGRLQTLRLRHHLLYSGPLLCLQGPSDGRLFRFYYYYYYFILILLLLLL